MPLLIPLGLAFAAEGTLEPRVSCDGDPAHSYALYRPAGLDPATPAPVLLVLDPRGDAVVAAERFFGAADAYGWVVASSWDTRSDVLSGPDPNTPAIAAVLADLEDRVSIDPDALVLAGFSGTARVGWEVAAALPELVYALLAVGAGGDARRAPSAVFLATGRRDFNHQEALRTDRALAVREVDHRVEVFDGGHAWPPAEVAGRMLGWAEVEGQRQGRRPADDARIDRALAAERTWLAGIDEPWTSREAHEEVVRAFDGLRDVSAERVTAERLATDPLVGAREVLERRLAREEARYAERLGALAQRLRDHDPARPRPAEALSTLGAGHVVEAASADGAEADAAARSLALTYASLVHYLPAHARLDDQVGHGAQSLAIAAEIWPADPRVRYDLACGWALSGQVERALDELERAVALGFADGPHLAADPDLAALHDHPRFEAIEAQLSAGGSSSAVPGDSG